MTPQTEKRTAISQDEARRMVELHSLKERMRDQEMAVPTVGDVAETLRISEAEAMQLLMEVRLQKELPARPGRLARLLPKASFFVRPIQVPRWVGWVACAVVILLVNALFSIWSDVRSLQSENRGLRSELWERERTTQMAAPGTGGTLPTAPMGVDGLRKMQEGPARKAP